MLWGIPKEALELGSVVFECKEGAVVEDEVEGIFNFRSHGNRELRKVLHSSGK